MKIVFTSDLHLGLHTDSFDRTNEIIDVTTDIIDHAIKLNKTDETIFVIGGDIFHTNTPSENLLTRFIKVLNKIRKADIETYIMVGNHDAIADTKRLSCLRFIKAIKSAYPSINLVEDITTFKVDSFDTGELQFTFLPHISKALIQSKVESKKLKQAVSTQEYIDSRCNKILEKVGSGVQHIVFSHLNVRGAHGGSEENLLKKSEVYLPNCFLNTPLQYTKPTIIQGHIHSRTEDGNIRIVGSPIFCTFGEAEKKKYFLEIDYHGDISKETIFNYIETDCTQFRQLEVDMITDTTSFYDRKDVKDFLKTIEKSNDEFSIKFDVLISPENNTYNWTDIGNDIAKEYDITVKPILPRVILKRPVKSDKQVINLHPDESMKIYLKRNLKNDVPRLRRIYKRSLKYTQGATNVN